MNLVASISCLCLVIASSACGDKSAAPAGPAAPVAGTAAAPTNDQIKWDDPDKVSGLDWPMQGVDPTPSVAASAFGRGTAQGGTAIWKRLGSYGGSFLKAWRQALEAADSPPPSDVVDAFNELALAVTGPTGFWRKTVPSRWLGCDDMAESEPCKKVASLNKELEQWDAIQKQIDTLGPDQANQFLSRNEARILAYLDTYVPTEPSAEAMKTTVFYQKNLAKVLDTMGGGPTAGGRDL